MTAGRKVVGLLLLALLSSACELVAGIDDRKLAAGGATGGSAGAGGHVATGGNLGLGGGLGTGGSSSDAASLGGGPGGGGAGGVAQTGGVSGSGAATSTTSSGGTNATGGTTSPDASSPDVPIGSGGIGDNGGTNQGGSTNRGGSTGSGGTRPEVGGERPPLSDAVPDTAGCPPAGALGTGSGLQGDYFPNKTLTNSVFTRIDPTVNFDWQYGAPEATLPSDGYSIRWTGQVQPRFSGQYTFYTDTDDGVRLWVNGGLLIDDWNDWAVRENAGTVNLVAGQKYDIKMEYYESGGLATAQLSWSSNCQLREVIPSTQLYPPPATCSEPAAGSGTGMSGNYFKTTELNTLVVTRTDPAISFNWPTGTSPAPGIPASNYSVRWTGQVMARYTGWTTFYVLSKDGARLFIDDKLVVDDWSSHAAAEDPGSVSLAAGQMYNIRLEYFAGGGGGQVQLSWASACQPREVVPQAQLFPTYAGVVCPDPGPGGGVGLRGDYYDNMDFTNLVATHAGEAVSFDWGTSAPDPSVGADTFSVRWTGKLLARYTGVTTFHTWSDDGVRLWIGGQPIIDDWVDHQAAEDVGNANLVAGQLYDVKLEFHENLENALIRLLWTGPCQPLEVVPATQLFPPGYFVADAGPDVADARADAADAGVDAADAFEAGVEMDGGGIDAL